MAPKAVTPFLTTTQISSLLQLSKPTILSFIQTHKLPAIKVQQSYLIEVEDLIIFCANTKRFKKFVRAIMETLWVSNIEVDIAFTGDKFEKFESISQPFHKNDYRRLPL